MKRARHFTPPQEEEPKLGGRAPNAVAFDHGCSDRVENPAPTWRLPKIGKAVSRDFTLNGLVSRFQGVITKTDASACSAFIHILGKVAVRSLKGRAHSLGQSVEELCCRDFVLKEPGCGEITI